MFPGLRTFAVEHAACILSDAAALWLGPWEMVPLAAVAEPGDPALHRHFEATAVAAHPSVFRIGLRSTALELWRRRVSDVWVFSWHLTQHVLRTPTALSH
jgi:hypothetical protein